MGEDRNRRPFENASLMEAANFNFLIYTLRSRVRTETEQLLKMPALRHQLFHLYFKGEDRNRRPFENASLMGAANFNFPFIL